MPPWKVREQRLIDPSQRLISPILGNNFRDFIDDRDKIPTTFKEAKKKKLLSDERALNLMKSLLNSICTSQRECSIRPNIIKLLELPFKRRDAT